MTTPPGSKAVGSEHSPKCWNPSLAMLGLHRSEIVLRGKKNPVMIKRDFLGNFTFQLVKESITKEKHRYMHVNE